MTIRNIAKALHRSPSTRFREINRNKIETNSKGRVYKYYPIKAQELYESRKKECPRKTVDQRLILANYFQIKLVIFVEDFYKLIMIVKLF